METLSELGVLFLLFEMGLELSLDRLKSLAKYAFGMGSLQVRLGWGALRCAAARKLGSSQREVLGVVNSDCLSVVRAALRGSLRRVVSSRVSLD